ncbi:hypothetical protein [Hymenobacter baengnokdamensis]|uniref:hypothetical protein n=1 Tax=Hymenobacter baengnokdamensis TaxID=2615203 RepID=UPI0012481C85|nr:hypothetical protein [Hymenobacter baengnokdamensis]
MSDKQHPLLDNILPRAELVSCILTVLGLGLKYLLFPTGNTLLLVGLVTLATVQYLRAFAPVAGVDESLGFDYVPVNSPSQQAFTHLLLPKIKGIASAVTLIGILFKLLLWKGAAIMLLTGVPALALIIAIQLATGTLPRLDACITALGIIVWLVPADTFIQQFYRDDPTLVDKMIYQQHHPKDPAAAAEVVRLLHARRTH